MTFALRVAARYAARGGPPEKTVGYVHMAVAGGAYPRGDPKETLEHAIWVDGRGGWLGTKTVCNKIKLDRMADIPGADRFCPTCDARVRKSKLSRLTKFE